MNGNPGESTFSAFCRLSAEYAVTHEDFIMLVPEELAKTPLLDKLPADKFIVDDGCAGSRLLKAAGLAVAGKKPWVTGSVSELAGGSYSHIREAAALPQLPVRIAAVNGGFSSAHEGAAVQLLEDIAIMRTIPGMNIFIPADTTSLQGMMAESENINGPLYIRLGSTAAPDVEERPDEANIFRGARILRPGSGITICACGIMVNQALAAADQLERQNISAEVIDCCGIKPFPEQTLLSSVRKTGCCVTAEEHGAIGGLFGAAAECLSRTYPVPMRSVAVADQFVSSGTSEELREYYGLTWQEIVDASAQVWALRRR